MLKGKTLLTPWQRQQSPSCSTYFSDSFLCGGSAPLPGFWGTPPQWKWSKSTAPFFPAQAKIMLSEIWSILNFTHQWLCKLSFISLRKGRVNGKNKTVCWKRGMWMNCFQTCILDWVSVCRHIRNVCDTELILNILYEIRNLEKLAWRKYTI